FVSTCAHYAIPLTPSRHHGELQVGCPCLARRLNVVIRPLDSSRSCGTLVLEACLIPHVPHPTFRRILMTTSDKQIEANRRNAEKSTGPTSPEGKFAVRLNALKHGLLARETVIAAGD